MTTATPKPGIHEDGRPDVPSPLTYPANADDETKAAIRALHATYQRTCTEADRRAATARDRSESRTETDPEYGWGQHDAVCASLGIAVQAAEEQARRVFEAEKAALLGWELFDITDNDND